MTIIIGYTDGKTYSIGGDSGAFEEGGLYQFDVNQMAPAAQIGFGARMQVAPNISLDIGYRYKGTFGPTPKLAETPPADGVTVTSSGKGSGNSSWIGVNVFQVGLDFKL